jgi:hypothetical protein
MKRDLVGKDPQVTQVEQTLAQLARDYRAHPWRERVSKVHDAARRQHALFLQMFPFRESPDTIDQRMVARQHVKTFIGWLENQLAWLGGLDLHGSDAAYDSAWTNIARFRELLRLNVPGSLSERSPALRVDGGWASIPRFGGDRHIAKKIITTYFLEETLPIFHTEHLEHFVAELGIDKDTICVAKFGKPYSQLDDGLDVGKKWEALTTALLNAKSRSDALLDEDNLYFTSCLYYLLTPANFKQWQPPR